MRERIKRVDDGYWTVLTLWLLSSATHEPTWATGITLVIVLGYLVYMMTGDEND